MADLTQIIAIGIKFEKLRRGSGICRAGGVATRKDEDVAIRIHSDAANFTKIEIVWQLQGIGHRVENDGWRLLRERRCA